MKHELFRLSHLSSRESALRGLHDFSASFCREDILCFFGSSLTDVLTVKMLMQGKLPLQYGRMLIDNQSCSFERLEQLVFVADGNTLVDTLPVFENLFVLRRSPYAFPLHRYSPDAAKREAENIFRQFETDLDVRKKAGALSGFQRLLVSLAQASIGAQPLVMIDLTPYSPNPQQQAVLRRYILHLHAMKKCVVILSSQPNDLLQICSQAVILAGGRIQKKLYDGEISVLAIQRCINLSLAFEERLPASRTSAAHAQAECCLSFIGRDGAPLCDVRHGETLGVWDRSWHIESSAVPYMQRLCARNGLSVRMKALQAPVEFCESALKRQKISVVSGSPQRYLFQKLSASENLAMSIYPNTARIGGRIHKAAISLLWNEFAEKFRIDRTVSNLQELSPTQKMLLVWYRGYLEKSRLLLCESPELFAGADGFQQLQRLLHNRSEYPEVSILFSYDYRFLRSVCDVVVLSNEGVITEIQTKPR